MSSSCGYVEDTCWICWGDSSVAPLERPCKCPRRCHAACMARWQLRCAGKSEETVCRFCDEHLARWQDALLLPNQAMAPAVMAVCFEGQVFRIPVLPGPQGRAMFQQQVRQLLQLQDDEEFDVTFACQGPDADVLQLSGLDAYEAAATCASLSAGTRHADALKERLQGMLPASVASAAAVGGDRVPS